jgi:hypothetical protein
MGVAEGRRRGGPRGGAGRDPPPERRDRAHRLRELREPRRHGGCRIAAHEQVRGRLPRRPLLRRLRGGRQGRAARDRAGEGAVRRGARERAAALRVHREPHRVLRAAAAGRPDDGPRARARRPPHARTPGELLRPLLRGRAVRGGPGDRDDRDEPGPRARAAASPEADRGGRERLPAALGLRGVPRRRGRGRRAIPDRHGARRRGSSPAACTRRRCRSPTS